MKAWQILVAGAVVLVAAFLLPFYERAIAAILAIALVAVVIFGFLLQPRRDVFNVQTNVYRLDHDGQLYREHDCIAVRVELAHLWLLFLPTFAAVAFLVITSARGTTWNLSLTALFDRRPDAYTFYFFLLSRIGILAVLGLLSGWVSERRLLRDASACSARSVLGGMYSFLDAAGDYYGGSGFSFRAVRPPELAVVVVYNRASPALNKIAAGWVFHRLVIIGRGLTDLDETVVAAHLEVAPVRVRP